MAGGIGSRFWPFSRNGKPKQFLDILGTGKSLIRYTFERFNKMIPAEQVYVVTNNDYKELVMEQLPELTEEQVLCEPLRRNTAPCIAYASHKIVKKNPDAIITVAPSDHLIMDETAFLQVIKSAIESAQAQDKLITIGLKPNRPETGFGYIQYIESDEDLKKVKTFTEKPQLELAKKFIESGDFVWNSGIFIWGVKAILEQFEQQLPEMAEIFNDIAPDLDTEKEEKAIQHAYAQCANISIDFGVMEKAQNVFTVLGDFGWSDLGSWNALHEQLDKDENNNAIQGNAMLYETSDSLIRTPKDKLTVVQGLKDYLVAECDNVLLICKKSDEQKFRDFVADIKERKGKQYL